MVSRDLAFRFAILICRSSCITAKLNTNTMEMKRLHVERQSLEKVVRHLCRFYIVQSTLKNYNT